MKIVDTSELTREVDRLIDLAYDKGRVAGYNQAKEEEDNKKADICKSAITEFIEKVVSHRIYDNDLNLADLEMVKNEMFAKMESEE